MIFYGLVLSKISKYNDAILSYEICEIITRNREKIKNYDIYKSLFELANKVGDKNLSNKYSHLLLDSKRKNHRASEYIFLTQTIAKDYIAIGDYELAVNILEECIKFIEENENSPHSDTELYSEEISTKSQKISVDISTPRGHRKTSSHLSVV